MPINSCLIALFISSYRNLTYRYKLICAILGANVQKDNHSDRSVIIFCHVETDFIGYLFSEKDAIFPASHV